MRHVVQHACILFTWLVSFAAATHVPVAHAGGSEGAPAPAPSDALAAAIRLWYDAPAEAQAAFEALSREWPGDDDVAWWLARARLADGRTEDALALLEGRRGRNVPQYRFAWLRAQALQDRDLAAARAELDRALLDAPKGERTPMLGLAARLAWRAGDELEAVARLRAGGEDPDLEAWAPLVAFAGLRVEEGGRARDVRSSGLVVPAVPSAEDDAPRQGPGPDLYRADGSRCFTEKGTRGDVAAYEDGWVYVAFDAPEGAGIHTIRRCGARPQLVRRGTGLGSPARLDGRWVWVEGGHVWADGARTGPERQVTPALLWPEAQVLRVATGEEGILVVVLVEGEPRLRYSPAPGKPLAPVFREDPAINRASWLPWQPGAPPPAAPPPPPTRPR